MDLVSKLSYSLQKLYDQKERRQTRYESLFLLGSTSLLNRFIDSFYIAIVKENYLFDIMRLSKDKKHISKP